MKYLHHEAKKFDIGIYFEANGHGTVMFKTEFKEKLSSSLSDSEYVNFLIIGVFVKKISKSIFSVSEEAKNAIKKLQTVIDLINETVGDALSDMLLVETILHSKGWNIQDWEKTYKDLPNRLLKVSVKVFIKFS